MNSLEKLNITVETNVNVPVEKAWTLWTNAEHITKWNFASPDWQCPNAETDLKPGGRFTYRMEAKDGSFGFDFGGIYTHLVNNEHVEYIMDDGRKARVSFTENAGKTTIVQTFEAESQNPPELQQAGWQAIMDNFKKYAETIK